jgi:type II secretory pathway component GspD/PulD (secretin)
MKRCLLAMYVATLLIAAPAYVKATTVEVITLKYRTAEEVIPILRPFVGSEGTISGMHDQLIVRTNPSNLSQIKKILARIDTRPRQLMITVRQNTNRKQLEREMAASGKVTLGDNVSVTVRNQGSTGTGAVEYNGGKDTVRGRGQSAARHEGDSDIQQIRVTEGTQAFIRTGSSVPVPERTIVRDSGPVRVIGSTYYRDLTSGFYVLPRLVEGKVILEISPQRESMKQEGTIQFQAATTRIMGRLGEWIEIGEIERSSSERKNEVVAGDNRGSSERYGIFVKVEEAK